MVIMMYLKVKIDGWPIQIQAGDRKGSENKPICRDRDDHLLFNYCIITGSQTWWSSIPRHRFPSTIHLPPINPQRSNDDLAPTKIQWPGVFVSTAQFAAPPPETNIAPETLEDEMSFWGKKAYFRGELLGFREIMLKFSTSWLIFASSKSILSVSTGEWGRWDGSLSFTGLSRWFRPGVYGKGYSYLFCFFGERNWLKLQIKDLFCCVFFVRIGFCVGLQFPIVPYEPVLFCEDCSYLGTLK